MTEPVSCPRCGAPFLVIIMNPTGVFFPTSVWYSNPPKAGHWSWPSRT